MRFSACIEWLFADTGLLPPLPGTPASASEKREKASVGARIRAAKAAGLDAVEFWHWSSKDRAEIRAALDETGLALSSILCEPITQITDPERHSGFLAGVVASRDAALALGAPVIIAQAGDDRAGVPRELQHAALVKVLREAGPLLAGSGVTLSLEPLNDRVDHPGYYLTSTVEGLDIIDEVDHPNVRLLYDIYHSAMMGEVTEDVLAGRVDRVVHVHLADTGGRGEPGSGTMDWQHRLEWLEGAGYGGFVGLEYKPSKPTVETLGFLAGVR